MKQDNTQELDWILGKLQEATIVTYLREARDGVDYDAHHANREKAIAAIQFLIRTEKLKLLAEVRERVEQSLPDTTFLGTSIRVKDNIRDYGYHDGVRDSRLSIKEEIDKLEVEL